MSDGTQSFVDSVHYCGLRKDLDETYLATVTPDGFKDVVLRPHQAVIVQALCELEDARKLKVISGKFANLTTNHQLTLWSSAIVLSEPVGSGKTIDILALILKRPIPAAFAEHENGIVIPKIKNDIRFSHTEIIKRITGPDALIRANLIVVGASVLVQWQNEIAQKCPKLRYFVIDNKYSVEEFISMIKSGDYKSYDIFLLKNGTYTSRLVLDGEDRKEVKEHRSLINIVSRVTQNKCWARIVYDDFDTISIPPGSVQINALSTIYVSATTKTPTISRIRSKKSYANILDQLRDYHAPLSEILHDDMLFTNFNLRNSDVFVKRSTSMPMVKKYCCIFDNPDDNYIRLIGVIGDELANAVMEMLNGDAYATAARVMGTESTSVADIFQRVLDQKYDKYIHDKRVLETLDKAKEAVNALKPPEDDKDYTQAELEAFKKQLTRCKLPAFKFHSTRLIAFLEALRTEFKAQCEEDGRAIDRVKENVKEGMCQVCCLPPSDSNNFIVRCCGIILCETCGIKGNRLGKKYDKQLKAHTIVGTCANCKSTIYPKRDLIFLDRSFDIERLADALGNEEDPLAVAPGESDESARIKNPKFRALLAIIKGKMPENARISNQPIPHLIEGQIDRPLPADQPRKVLVFANYSETLDKLEELLTEHDIEYLKLNGNARDIAKTVTEFKTRGQVLLINSQLHCAGLNLTFCTDGVFFHKIIDPNIESQVAGRLQRMGREYNAMLWSLHYKNEEYFAKKAK